MSDRDQRGLISSILDLPRYIRLLIVVVFTLASTLAVFSVVDDIYIRFFFSEDTIIVPSLITAAIGLTMYVVGWFAMVGTVGEKPEPTPLVRIYLGFGILALILLMVWLIRLIILGSS